MPMPLPLLLAVAFIVAALIGSDGVFAQTSAAPGTAARVQQERATCDGVQQDKAACLREAGAAKDEAGRGGLSSPGDSSADANALARCQMQPPADRADCEARVRGTGATSTSGSVMGGGVVRETVTPIPAPAPAK
jgi:hypothetical protein